VRHLWVVERGGCSSDGVEGIEFARKGVDEGTRSVIELQLDPHIRFTATTMSFPFSDITTDEWSGYRTKDKLDYLAHKILLLQSMHRNGCDKTDQLFNEFRIFFKIDMWKWIDDPLQQGDDEKLHCIMEAYEELEKSH
jgi:hypothetical protein